MQALANAVQAKLDRGLTSRVLQSDNDISEVKDLIGKIMSLIDVFEVSPSDVLFPISPSVQFEGGILVEIGVEHIKVGVDQIQHGVDHIKNGVDLVKGEVEQVKGGVEEVKDGVGQVQDGVAEVARGVDDINRVRILCCLRTLS